MATYSSHRLVMGKEEIDRFFVSRWGYLDFLTEMFIEYFSTFHMTFGLNILYFSISN